MGQDWPNGDEPACGDMFMWLERAACVFLVLVALFVVSACDTRCTEHAQKIQGADVFLCVKGKWVRQDNPYQPSIKAIGRHERSVGSG